MVRKRQPARQEGPTVRRNAPNGVGGGHAPLLSRRGLTAWLGVSERHTYELERAGLPRLQLGGCVRFDPEDVLRFLNERRRCAGLNRRIDLDAGACVSTDAVGASHQPVGDDASSDRTEKRILRRSGRAVLAAAIPDYSVAALAPCLAAQALAKLRSRGGRS